MTDRMAMERIKHKAAQAVFEGTEYNWVDMLDQTEEADRRAMKMIPIDQENFWLGYFNDMLEAVRWSDANKAE